MNAWMKQSNESTKYWINEWMSESMNKGVREKNSELMHVLHWIELNWVELNWNWAEQNMTDFELNWKMEWNGQLWNELNKWNERKQMKWTKWMKWMSWNKTNCNEMKRNEMKEKER